jgi:hypothetical protein
LILNSTDDGFIMPFGECYSLTDPEIFKKGGIAPETGAHPLK